MGKYWLVNTYKVVPRDMGRPWQGTTLPNLYIAQGRNQRNIFENHIFWNWSFILDQTTVFLASLGLSVVKNIFLPVPSCRLLQIRGWELSVSSLKSFQPNFPEPLTHKLSAKQTKDPRNPQQGLLSHLNKKEIRSDIMITTWFSNKI